MPLTATGARGFLAGRWSWLSLHTGDVPTPANELSGGGYARAALAWEASQGGVVASSDPVFAVADAAWPEVHSLAIRDAEGADAEILAYVGLSAPVITARGRRPAISAEVLELAIGTAGGALAEAGRIRLYGERLVRGTWLSLHTGDPQAGGAEMAGLGYARRRLSDAAPFDMVVSDAPRAAFVNARRIEMARSTGLRVDPAGDPVYDADRSVSASVYAAAVAAMGGGASPDPRGAASDGTHLWVVDASGAVVAFAVADLPSGGVVREKSLTPARTAAAVGVAPGTPVLTGAATDGETLWICDNRSQITAKVVGLDVQTMARNAARDIGNQALRPVWRHPGLTGAGCDGTTLWIATGEDRLSAFRVADLVADPASDFSTRNNNVFHGVAAEGDDLWVVNGTSTVMRLDRTTRAIQDAETLNAAKLRAALGYAPSLYGAAAGGVDFFSLWLVDTVQKRVLGFDRGHYVEPITHAALWDRQAGGTRLYSFALAEAVQWPDTGGALMFEAGAFAIDFTASHYTVVPERAKALVSDAPLDLAIPLAEPADVAPSRRAVAEALADRTPRNDPALRAFVREVMGQVLEAGPGIEILPQVDGRLEVAERGRGTPAAVARYIAAARTAGFTASDFVAGATSTTRTLGIPLWPPDEQRYLALAYPASEGPLRSVTYDRSAVNQVASWEALSNLSINAVEYRVYRLYGEALGTLSGSAVNLGY